MRTKTSSANLVLKLSSAKAKGYRASFVDWFASSYPGTNVLGFGLPLVISLYPVIFSIAITVFCRSWKNPTNSAMIEFCIGIIGCVFPCIGSPESVSERPNTIPLSKNICNNSFGVIFEPPLFFATFSNLSISIHQPLGTALFLKFCILSMVNW